MTKQARSYFEHDANRAMTTLGKEALLAVLRKMLLIRNLEMRGEAAYQQGLVGGFYHSYAGQEAIQTAALEALGPDNWFVTTYRCHALALLLGVTPKEIMAELLGRKTGNAKGRGGSMHLYTDRMLGGFGIVSNQIPVAAGAAFSLKYLEKKGEVAVCFMGDGAVAQGAFHEAMNLASLWELPCLYVIENNRWGMGTAVERAISVERLAEDIAPGYGIKAYSFDGMDFLHCYEGFLAAYREVVETGRPVLIEAVTGRFRGHSISDPGAYRTKEELKKSMERDPILLLKNQLIEAGFLHEEDFKQIDSATRQEVVEALAYAQESPWPDPIVLEEDVFAP